MKEPEIEKDFINKLIDLKYVYRQDINDKASLELNFRQKFDKLNKVTLTDREFSRLIEQIITPDIFTAACTLRKRNSFERDDGTPLHYTIINIKDWCKNSFEVINQLRINTDNSNHRYDVILLINGVPAVQIELKTLNINPHRAMQQIVKYKSDPGNGYGKTLMCFLQLFIVSNRSDTWYFANNNKQYFNFDADEQFLPLYQFAGRDNKKITHLYDFAEKFLAKCTLAQMINRYMVLVASEQKLMMMRPYQIYAVKSIVDCIHQNCGNGYIWHTTGSGKTLTSFKASTLLKDNSDVEKCLFVVDRKDLDRQTREEFNRFQEGCVEENTNTKALVNRLLSDDYADKVIVTTIQKLGLALDEKNNKNYKKQLKPLKNKRMVFIFDECHRSQFGENHKSIKDFFPNAQLFGFTGTPIFEQNATYKTIEGGEASYKTTKDIFQKELHEYTITHAIEDGNVLQFNVDYYKPEGKDKPKLGETLAKEAVVEVILEKHDAATAGRKFNAILATASINDAIAYYELFKQIQLEKKQENPDFKPLNIACAFSPPAEGNKDVKQLQEDLPQEKADNTIEPNKKKEALNVIIKDYNDNYRTNYSINEFDSYYQNVQKRIKDHQYPNKDLSHEKKIDLTIVVDMLLTGFDSKFLNTLYVDKNLKYHGLIQAFSRTNRVLNNSKPYGNILDFRGQEDAVEEAIVLFSGKEFEKAKEIWLVDDAPTVIGKLDLAVKELNKFMESQDLKSTPEEVSNIKGDIARSEFINTFKDIQRIRTQLDQYTDLTKENKEEIEEIMPKETMQAFKGVYIGVSHKLKAQQDKKGGETTLEVQNLDFQLVLFSSSLIDYDYIMQLLAKSSQEEPDKQKMTRDQLVSLIKSDAKFMGESEDLIGYMDSLQAGKALQEKDIINGYRYFKAKKIVNQQVEIAAKYGLEASGLQKFVALTLERMIFDDEQLSDLFTPLGLGWKDRSRKKEALMEELIPVLRKLADGRDISGLNVY